MNPRENEPLIYESQWKNVNALRFCAIKAVLSGLEETARYPLVLIKTHQQVVPEAKQSVFRSGASFAPPNKSAQQASGPGTHKTFQYILKIYRRCGVSGLFRGLPWYVLP